MSWTVSGVFLYNLHLKACRADKKIMASKLNPTNFIVLIHWI